jgi:hypothetical protein
MATGNTWLQGMSGEKEHYIILRIYGPSDCVYDACVLDGDD